METKVVKHASGPAIVLTEKMLQSLGVREGDVVEVNFEGRSMVVRRVDPFVTDEAFDVAMAEVFEENAEVLKELSR